MLRSTLWVSFVLLVLVLLVFTPAWQAGLVGDWTGLAWRIQESRGARDILTNFGFPAHQQLLNVFLYAIYSSCRSSPLCWHLVFTGLHALNGLLFFLFLRRLSRQMGAGEIWWLPLAGTAFFLFNPYQSEPVIYKACFNWLFSSTLILTGLIAFLRWRRDGSPAARWLVLGSFLAGLFVFEHVMMMPLYLGLLYLALPAETGRKRSLGIGLGIGLPLLVILAGYLLLNKLTFGEWVGHYGQAVHLQLDFSQQWGTVLKYLSKVYLLSRYTIEQKDAHYAMFDQAGWQWAALTGLLLAAFLAVRYWRSCPVFLRLGLILGGMGLIALLPVSNLYFYHLLLVTNDRYSYLASGFLLAALVSGLGLLPAQLRWLPITALLIVHLYFLRYTIGLWQQNARVYYHLMEDFPLDEERPVFLLNLPDNYMGIFLFQHNKARTGLLHPLRYVLEVEPKAPIYEVINFNMVGPEDGVEVVQEADSTLQVRFKQGGNWWWRKGLGGVAYETDAYRWEPQPGAYRLHFKPGIPPESVFLYADSLKWHAFEWNPALDTQER